MAAAVSLAACNLLRQLNQVTATIVEHCRHCGSHPDRRLREEHTLSAQALIVRLNIANGKRRKWKAVLHQRTPERTYSRPAPCLNRPQRCCLPRFSSTFFFLVRLHPSLGYRLEGP